MLSPVDFATAKCSSTISVCFSLVGRPIETECHELSLKLFGELS
jgi:hypothetical protein